MCMYKELALEGNEYVGVKLKQELLDWIIKKHHKDFHFKKRNMKNLGRVILLMRRRQ